MPFRSLVDVAELETRLDDPSWALVDCRFTLGEPERGERDYLAGHIPGAVYAHLDRDLSAAVEPGRTGRHPLPTIAVLAQRLGGWGIDQGVQVLAYDDMGGAFAARLWWLLRWLGHDAVAVLDGGWPAWLAAGGARRAGRETRPPQAFKPRPRPELVVDATTVAAMAGDPSCRVLDARGADRYRGENETIDPVAGHIPGAISAPFADNLDAEGRFLSPEVLRERYRALLGETPAERSAAYCGSGVTGAHDLLAMARAGIEGARLYAGSWSEWITDPHRPVATGPDPGGSTEG